MATIPGAVLSEQFQQRMSGRRLIAAVFLTYQFEPGFFEQEVLPVFLDVPLSHVPKIRLLQLEDAVRDLPGEIAVYYDVNGLVVGDGASAKLDVRRIPIRLQTGVFHPKNVLLLVESEEADAVNHRKQTLVFATMSANLTRAGWWENVEACHIEEVDERSRTSLKDDLRKLTRLVRDRGYVTSNHTALDEIDRFLSLTSQSTVGRANGRLLPRLYCGEESVGDFLNKVARNEILNDCNKMEVISPYFDAAPNEKSPLQVLVDRFLPSEVRVFLPRADTGAALCTAEMYDSAHDLECSWGELARELTRLGKSSDAGDRRVHAKVYRFFSNSPKRELCFIGSPNLTRSAHQRGGNFETGILVDVDLPRRPDFWLQIHEQRPREFQSDNSDEEIAGMIGSRLSLTYFWDRATAEAYWDADEDSPLLTLYARGQRLGEIGPLPSRTTTPVPPELATQVGSMLGETSLITVVGEGGEPTMVLVQELEMSHKPSIFQSLSVSEILRYWSLLSPSQRASFLEATALIRGAPGEVAELDMPPRLVPSGDTLFDRFAGYFHAFASLERAVRDALELDNFKSAANRIFGRKFDSLGSLLERVDGDEGVADDVDRYVIFLSARQLCQEVRHDFGEFWDEHRAEARELEKLLTRSAEIRQRLLTERSDRMADFLDWFDRWFLERVRVEEAQS